MTTGRTLRQAAVDTAFAHRYSEEPGFEGMCHACYRNWSRLTAHPCPNATWAAEILASEETRLDVSPPATAAELDMFGLPQ